MSLSEEVEMPELSVSCACGDKTMWGPGREASTESSPDCTLVWDLQFPEPWENSVLFKPPSPCTWLWQPQQTMCSSQCDSGEDNNNEGHFCLLSHRHVPALCLGALQMPFIQTTVPWWELLSPVGTFFSQESKRIALASGSDLPLNKIWPFKESF